MPKRVEVWLKQPNKRIDAFYDYAVPPAYAERVAPGVRVVVPFGTGSKATEGFITAVKPDSEYEEKLKDLIAVIDDAPVLTWDQIRLCDWIRRYYCAMFYEALAPFTAPVRVIEKRPLKDDPDQKPRYDTYSARYQRPAENAGVPVDLSATLQDLMDRYAQDRNDAMTPCTSAFFAVQDPEQRFDLYCAIAKREQVRGKQTMILYPETTLAKHHHRLFSERFGDRSVLCYGNQKPAARYKAYEQVRRDEADVILGSRSALFLPVDRLGTIIIDSPWDSSYTAMAIPRYDTLRTAKAYCRMTGACLVTGGPVIPVGIMAEIQAGLTKSYPLQAESKPSVRIVDLKNELRKGNRSLISGDLDRAIRNNLSENKKTLLMLNRAGYGGAAFCRDCGYVSKCPHCDVHLRNNGAGMLYCPYCDFEKTLEQNCPNCGSTRYRPAGTGIEQAEGLLKKSYPNARILRVDGAAADSQEAFENLYDAIASGQWDLIIGTNMLLKGFDFGEVALVAVLLMDGALNLSDYAASEEAYLLYQQFFNLASDRAIGQTYQPDHDVIRALTCDDPAAFYESELQYRKLFAYPPCGHMVIFTLTRADREPLCEEAAAFYATLDETMTTRLTADAGYKSYPPTYEGIRPGDGVHQCRILVKIKKLEPFHSAIWQLINAGEIEKLKAKVSIQIDPKASV